MVLVGERTAKASHNIKPGDQITIKWRDRVTRVRVRVVPENRQTSRKQAGDLYEQLSDDAADVYDPES
jgi:ribosomal 50S subunit-recycling heat shock protein